MKKGFPLRKRLIVWRRVFEWKVLLLITCYFYYAAGTSTSGAVILKQGVGARQLGLGEAFVAIADDINTIYYNPAGLVNIKKPELGMMYQKSLADTIYGFLGFGCPIKTFSINSVVGVGIITLQNSKIELNFLNKPSEIRIAQQDYVLCLSYSLVLFRNFSFGTNLKYVQSTLVEESNASAITVDLGGLYKLTQRFSCGIVLQNVGATMSYHGGIATGKEGDYLPLNISFGTSYKIFEKETDKISLAFTIKQPNDSKLKFNIGAEYSIYFHRIILNLRTGYKIGYDTSNLTFGTGINWEKIQLDYGFGFIANNLGNNHRLSLTVRF